MGGVGVANGVDGLAAAANPAAMAAYPSTVSTGANAVESII